jgi:hypothetical protein
VLHEHELTVGGVAHTYPIALIVAYTLVLSPCQDCPRSGPAPLGAHRDQTRLPDILDRGILAQNCKTGALGRRRALHRRACASLGTAGAPVTAAASVSCRPCCTSPSACTHKRQSISAAHFQSSGCVLGSMMGSGRRQSGGDMAADWLRHGPVRSQAPALPKEVHMQTRRPLKSGAIAPTTQPRLHPTHNVRPDNPACCSSHRRICPG